MPNQSRRAAKGLIAFAAGVAALTGSGANAQTDPFALPKTATATAATAAVQEIDGPGPSEIEVDGQLRARLVDLQGRGEALTIDAANARVAGLPVPETANGPIPLSTLKIHKWSFDPLRQRLAVTLLRRSDGPNFRDFARRDAELAQRRTIAALRIDYDFAATVTRRGASAAGLVGAALVKGDFVAATGARVGTETAAIRLDSFVQMRLPRSTAIATMGDFVSAGSSSQRALRLGGVQIASDFAQQPDLVTAPMPAFSGAVAVPTTLDILTADNRYNLGKIEPGEFTVRNIPTNPGRGSMAVLLRDSLGRETVRTVSFYVSNTLLRPGLSAYAANAGFVRRRYGVASDDYGPLVASAYYRRGLSPFLTLEASGESTPGLLNFGSRADFTIGNVALASVGLRGSRDSRAGTGAMLSSSLESLGRGVGGRIGVTLPTADYRDVASHLGDRPPPRCVFANLIFDLRRNMPLQLAWVRQTSAARPGAPRQVGERDEVVSASLFHSPSQRVNFSLVGGMRAGAAGRSAFVTAGISIRFGARHSLSAGANEGAGQSSATLAWQYNDQQNSGLRAQASLGTLDGAPRITGSAIHEGRWSLLQANVAAGAGEIAGQVSATGALIATGGTVYARSRSNNGYVLVRAGGVAGIPVKLENRFVGKTDRRGRLLVQNLRTLVPQHIDVDPAMIPDDAVVLTSRHVVSVPLRAVGLVDIKAMYFRPVVLRIVDASGAPLAAGLPVVAGPSGRDMLVGYDGLVEFNSASGDRRLLVKSPAGDCVLELDALPEQDTPLVCRAVGTIAAAEGPVAPAPAPARERAAKVARRD